MTGVSSLQSFHKKGLFGDHHKKNESSLLKISEIKGLSIVQIAQYKRSKIQLKEIQIDGVKFPLSSPNVEYNEKNKNSLEWSKNMANCIKQKEYRSSDPRKMQ